MSGDSKSETPIFNRIVDIGTNKQFSVTEKRYLQVTNIAAVLGGMFNAIWMLITISLSEAPLIYGSNGFLGVMFLIVLVLNNKGWRVAASMWLAFSS